jgi:hypothetical protein
LAVEGVCFYAVPGLEGKGGTSYLIGGGRRMLLRGPRSERVADVDFFFFPVYNLSGCGTTLVHSWPSGHSMLLLLGSLPFLFPSSFAFGCCRTALGFMVAFGLLCFSLLGSPSLFFPLFRRFGRYLCIDISYSSDLTDLPP